MTTRIDASNFTANGKPIHAKDTLRVHAGTDEFMRGARYVTVTSVRNAGFAGAYIRHDMSKTPLGFRSAGWLQANTVHAGEQFDV